MHLSHSLTAYLFWCSCITCTDYCTTSTCTYALAYLDSKKLPNMLFFAFAGSAAVAIAAAGEKEAAGVLELELELRPLA